MIDCKQVKKEVAKILREKNSVRLKELEKRFEKRLEEAVKKQEDRINFIVFEDEADIIDDFIQILIDHNYTIMKNEMHHGDIKVVVSGWIL